MNSISIRIIRLFILGSLLFVGLNGIAQTYAFDLPIPPKSTQPPQFNPPCTKFIRIVDGIKLEKGKQQVLNYLKTYYPQCFALTKLTNLGNQENKPFLKSLIDTDLISQEILLTFPKENILLADETSVAKNGHIKSVTILEDPNIFGEWMEAKMNITTEKITANYLAVFHLEDNAWKIFGTELLE